MSVEELIAWIEDEIRHIDEEDLTQFELKLKRKLEKLKAESEVEPGTNGTCY